MTAMIKCDACHVVLSTEASWLVIQDRRLSVRDRVTADVHACNAKCLKTLVDKWIAAEAGS